VETGLILQRFLTGLPVRMEASRQTPEMHAVILDVDEATGRARAVRRHAIGGD
jgi:calcineurin-like phosphoesterase